MKKNIEKEYKYNINSEILYGEEAFNKIIEELNLTNKTSHYHSDTYYDNNEILENARITVRERYENGKSIITIKVPKDLDNINERQELDFNNVKEVYDYIKNVLEIPINKLNKKAKLITERDSYIFKHSESIFEISFDKFRTEPFSFELTPSYMIECELKEGTKEDLDEVNNIIMNLGYTSICSNSKLEIASKLNNKKKKEEFITSIPEDEYQKKLVSYFSNSSKNKLLLEELKKLDNKKQEIRRLKNENGPLEEPLVITLSGTPRAGKTTCIDNLFEFLKKSDLKTKCLEEPAGIIYSTLKTKEEKKNLLQDRVGFVEKQFSIGKEYINNNLEGNDIILCDRGSMDPFIWYDMYYRLGMINEEDYKLFINKLNKEKEYTDMFYALYTDSEQSMKRDYLSSLSIEQRTTMNETNINRYNTSLLRMMPIFKDKLDYTKFIDTTNKDKMDASLLVANEVLDKVKRLYIKH